MNGNGEAQPAPRPALVPPGKFADLEDVIEVDNLWDVLAPRPSPLGGGGVDERLFVSNGDRVAVQALVHGSADSMGAGCPGASVYDVAQDVCVPVEPWAMRSGPRREVYFDPREVQAAVVTCGGLCPGLNDVVKGLVNTLETYGVPRGNVIGVRYGFQGFYKTDTPPVILSRAEVAGIQHDGGTVLGTSRGGSDTNKIVDAIQNRKINMVFVVGGNGGNAGAAALQAECKRRAYPCAVVGIPKSIDNDILLIDKTFGFDTAVGEAVKAINAAYVESTSAYRGVGVVKLMGRQSGFIATYATLASGEVDLCMIPELQYTIHGPGGVLEFVEATVARKGHCNIVVAEGALQDQLKHDTATDLSGNPILECPGLYLRGELKAHFQQPGREKVDLKYIDPSYMIRSVETNTADKIFCIQLAQGAVHAAFAGFTGITVGVVNNHTAYLPIGLVVSAPRVVDPEGKSWQRVLSITGQPASFVPDPAGAEDLEASRTYDEGLSPV